MMPLLRVFLRGYSIVLLTAANTYQVAHGYIPGSFMVGFGISWLWWSNANLSAHTQLRYARVTYALGAGLGTISGMTIMSWLYR